MDDLEKLKIEVFSRKKVLADIYSNFKNLSLFDYAGKWPVAPLSAEANALTEQMTGLLERIYPPELAGDVVARFNQNPLVSTIDHHGILNHPFFINSNLIFSLKAGQKYLLCLTTAGVSLNNSSWPGCLVFTGENGQTRRLSFFPDRLKNRTVFSAPALTQSNIDAWLAKLAKEEVLDLGQKDKLRNLVEEIFNDNKGYQLKNFSEQASLISTVLWSKIFPSAPKVIYLSLEDLASQMLIKTISPDPKHVLHKLFFTAEGWNLVQKYFKEKNGALFWGVDSKGRRVSSALTPKNIADVLSKRQLYPTGLTCSLVLLYYQVTCLGGFNQVNWLTEVKAKFLELLKETGESGIIERVKKVPTDNFAEGNLAFLLGEKNLIKATGIDLYLTGQDYYLKYQSLAKILTVGESIESLLPEIYKIAVPMEERDTNLAMVTDEAIADQNGTAKKIRQILV